MKSVRSKKILRIVVIVLVGIVPIRSIAQNINDVSVSVNPATYKFCYGGYTDDITITISEKVDTTFGISASNPYTIIITAPNGLVFSNLSAITIAGANFSGTGSTDISSSAVVPDPTNKMVIFTFRTDGKDLRDKITISNVRLSHDFGYSDPPGTSINVNVSLGTGNAKDFTRGNYTMDEPTLDFSKNFDNTINFCPMMEELEFNYSLNISSSDGNCKPSNTYVYRKRPSEGTPIIIGSVASELNGTITILTSDLMPGDELFAVSVVNERQIISDSIFTVADALSIAPSPPQNVIKIIQFDNNTHPFYRFNAEGDGGFDNQIYNVSSAKIPLLGMLERYTENGTGTPLEPYINTSTLGVIGEYTGYHNQINPPEEKETYLTITNSNNIFYPDDLFLHLPILLPIPLPFLGLDDGDTVKYRFEFPRDPDHIYENLLDAVQSNPFPQNAIIDAFNDTKYFEPSATWLRFEPDKNTIIYKEVVWFQDFGRNCPFVDSIHVGIYPEDINIPHELCASDTTTYIIRVSHDIPNNFPGGTKYDHLEVRYGDSTIVLDSIPYYNTKDTKATYYEYNPSEWFDRLGGNVNSPEYVVSTIARFGEYTITTINSDGDPETTGPYPIEINKKNVYIYSTNINDFTILGFDTTACYNPEDSSRLSSNYEIDTIKGISAYEASENGVIDWYIKPSVSYDSLGLGNNIISDSIDIFFTDNNGCYGSVQRGFRVFPAPVVDFSYDYLCLDDTPIPFSSEGSVAGDKDTIIAYQWSFGDGTVYTGIEDVGHSSGTAAEPLHQYQEAGYYNVVLEATTDRGCSAEKSDTIRVDEIPIANFSFRHTGLEQQSVLFTNESDSTLFPDPEEYEFQWNFGYAGGRDTTYSFGEHTSYTYTVPRIYNVSLNVVTTNNCSNMISKKVPVFPYVEVTNDNFAFYDFSEANGWLANHEFQDNVQSDWHRTEVSPEWQDSKHTGGDMWVTGTPSNAINNESGWLESPCFDFRDLSFPMISLDIYNSIEPGRDGAVIQYTLNDGITWKRLGQPGGGANWYNRDGIYSNPGANDGGINLESYGWSKDTNAWVVARYILDNVKKESNDSGTCVRFRIAYNSNDYHDSEYQGFALDNFLIGKRKRIVLLEQMINQAWEDNQVSPAIPGYNSDSLNAFVDANDEEVVDIRYHVNSGTYEDPLFEAFNNIQDPSVRAMEYGADLYGPMWVMDGSAVKSVIHGVYQKLDYNDALEKRALIDPAFEIDTVVTELAGNSLQISVTLHKVSLHIDEKLGLHDHHVRIAIVQKNYTDESGTDYRNVLIDILPNGIGNTSQILRKPFPVDSLVTVTDTWTPNIKTEGNNYRLIVFVQGQHNYEEVEQVWFRDLDISEVPQLSTGIGNISGSGSQMTLYPNPVTDRIHIVVPEGFGNGTTWTIYSTNGQVIKSGMFYNSGNKEIISTEGLTNGFYLIRLINSNGEQITSRFSKTGH